MFSSAAERVDRLVMPEFIFQPRYVIKSVRNPDLDWLRDLILEPFLPGREFGEAFIEYRDGQQSVSLILLSDRQLGYYLKHFLGKETWLSLGDAARLSEVVCPDDWEASAGLFVSPADAWSAIREFCLTGSRSSAIQWIRPSEVPPDGNR